MKKWFHHLKVSQKLMLISIFFIMPDSLMLYLFITGINTNIRFAEWEKKGNEYQRPLEELLEFIPEHQTLAQQTPVGEAQANKRLSSKQAQIEHAFETLQSVDARIGAQLQFTTEGLAKRKREHCRVETLRKEWRELKVRLADLSPEARAEQHRHLISDVRTMITHAGDLSNLILDPDLDSYYMMDATLLALPQTQERLATAMGQGEAILKQRTISHKEREQLVIHATLLKEADLDRIRSSVQTALNEDPNFRGTSPSLQRRVPQALKDYVSAAEAFIDLTTRMVSSEQGEVTEEKYHAAGQKAREASFKLWRIADEELDTLLQKRIESYEQRRATSLLVSALALLAAVAFVTFITRSISGPLRRQAAELTSANEALQDEMAERNRAEAELRRSEAQLAAAQKIARIGSWEWDVRADRMTWSEENYRIHGFERRQFPVSYEAALQFIHPEERGLADTTIKRALQQGNAFAFEQRILRPDGTERIIHQRGDVVLDADGRATKVFGTAQDVTERKRAEEELEHIHRQLLHSSRQAGMAEVATGILHNVGNVLNSVNISSSLVTEQLKKSKASGLSKVAAMLRAHEADLGTFVTTDPKGKQLPAYLALLADHFAEEQAAAMKELAQLQKDIDHIKDIVAMQQGFAKVSGITETLKVADLVEDALRMNSSALIRHDIQIVKDLEDGPAITTEKHKVLQILVNLINNAKHACHGSGRQQHELTIRVRHGNDRVRIAVSDNGVGIPPENLTRIFNHGFTTKKNGHGFGLHSGALAAKELGGSLIAHSDGAGCGATFTIELPIERSVVSHGDGRNQRSAPLLAAEVLCAHQVHSDVLARAGGFKPNLPAAPGTRPVHAKEQGEQRMPRGGDVLLPVSFKSTLRSQLICSRLATHGRPLFHRDGWMRFAYEPVWQWHGGCLSSRMRSHSPSRHCWRHGQA
jgi:PAS domain S-box-containing protein